MGHIRQVRGDKFCVADMQGLRIFAPTQHHGFDRLNAHYLRALARHGQGEVTYAAEEIERAVVRFQCQ